MASWGVKWRSRSYLRTLRRIRTAARVSPARRVWARDYERDLTDVLILLFKMVDERSDWYAFIKADPPFDSPHADPPSSASRDQVLEQDSGARTRSGVSASSTSLLTRVKQLHVP
jgi:hypothetical protein